MLRTRQFFGKNEFTVEVEVTPYCNFTCEYCENKNTATFENFSKFNINFDALHKFLSTYNKKCTLLLNGGEPTIHPFLSRFCNKMMQHSNITIILYTNFSANESLYKQLASCNVKIYPTYHEEYYNIKDFAKKLTNVGIQETLVPCTKHNIENIQNIMQSFKTVRLVLLENHDISLTDLCKLSKIDKTITDQYKILRKAMQQRVCKAAEKYLYINGDGSIHHCMFFDCRHPIGDIYKSDMLSLISSVKHVCSNYCFYEF